MPPLQGTLSPLQSPTGSSHPGHPQTLSSIYLLTWGPSLVQPLGQGLCTSIVGSPARVHAHVTQYFCTDLSSHYTHKGSFSGWQSKSEYLRHVALTLFSISTPTVH